MKKFFLVLLAVLGALAILAGVVILIVGGLSAAARGSVPSRTVIEIDFERGYEEFVPDDPVVQALHGKQMSVLDVVQALERAAADDRVAAIVARVGAAPMGLGRMQELRDAVIAFRESGKPAIAWAETFGEFGPSTGAYYLATGFDEIYLQPSGDLGLTGIMYESPFLRGMFDKLGIVPRMDHRYEYKNAMNMYTETKFTPPHREAMDSLMRSQFGQVVRGIAEARQLSEDRVRELADRAPLLGAEALEAKLVDGLAYRDEVYERIKTKLDGRTRFLYIDKYWEKVGSPYDRGPTIALIHGVGAVARGDGGFSPLGGMVMGSDTVARAFRDAVADDDVKAILFRVDSPGGSYVASDTILREVRNARRSGKPVVVSMGDVAGSGGYFVALDADKIVSQPGTITGSIGVLAGKLLTGGLWDKTGISWDEVHTSESSTMWTGTHDYTDRQWDRFQDWLDRIYEDFTTKVAEGRRLPKETVLRVARGRIWSGEDAKDLGLVDETGGFPVALRLAREAAGLDPDAKVTLEPFPRKRTLFEALMDRGREGSEPASIEAIRRLYAELGPVVRLARRAGLFERTPGVLSMTPGEPAP